MLPPRNLPGDADQWGREVETRLRTARSAQKSSGGAFSNLERATSGQLGASEIQVDELLNQVTQSVYPPPLSVTGSLNVEPFNRVSASFVFPPVPGSRSAFLSIGASVSNEGSLFATSIILVKYLGEVIMRQPPLPSGNSASDPTESQGSGTFSDFARIMTFSDAPVTVEMEVIRLGSAESTVTVSNIQASLSRSGS